MSRTARPHSNLDPQVTHAVVLAVALAALVAPLAGCRTPPDAPPQSWGNIHSGIPRERLLKRLGTPTGKSGRGGDSWSANGWVLDVEYDQDGLVTGSSQGHAARPADRP